MPKFKRDAPVEEPAPLSFLLGLKWQLDQWGYDKKFNKVDDGAFTVKFDGKLVAHASAPSGKLVVEWLSQEWKDWSGLQESSELKALVAASDKKL